MVNVLGFNNQLNVYYFEVAMITRAKPMKIVLTIVITVLQMVLNALH